MNIKDNIFYLVYIILGYICYMLIEYEIWIPLSQNEMSTLKKESWS